MSAVATRSGPVVYLPRMRPDQWEIARHPARVKVLSMGRRWGKTVLGGNIAIPTAAQGGKVAWVALTYKNGRPLWRAVESALGDLAKRGGARLNKAERTVEIACGGGWGFLGIYSGDNPASIRGEDFDLVIIDECSRLPEEVWTSDVEPTLADRNGSALLISTPTGKNWFWQWWLMGQGAVDEREVKSWRAPSSDNPSPNIRRAAGLAQERLPERVYEQEWLAQFLDTGGEVFRLVRTRATGKPQAPYSGVFVLGVDFGQTADWTVITVWDAESRTMVEMDRFHGISWALQRARIRAMSEKWAAALVYVEANSMGGPNAEALMDDGVPVVQFLTTAQTKPPLIQNMVLAMERAEITLLDDSRLIAEFEGYQQKASVNTGRLSYGSPPGMHDDIVMSACIGYFGCTRMSGGIYL